MEGIGGEVSTNQPNELPAEPHVQVQTTGTAASTSAALDSLGNESSNPTAPDATAGDDDSAACSANTMPATTDGIIAEGKRTIQQFLRDHTCYNVLKDSGKVVVFDVQIPVKLAFFALVEHDVKSSPLWDSAQQKFVGMITASDFIDILKHFHTNSDGSAGDDLSEHSIASWRASVADRNPESQNLQPLVFVSPEQTVFDACALLHNSRIHRLPIIDAEQNSVLSIVTHQVLLEFLVSNFREQRRLFDQPVQELGIGTYGDDVIVVQESMALIEVLDLLIARCISAVPVVDSSGVVVNVYCRTDVTVGAVHVVVVVVLSHIAHAEPCKGPSSCTSRHTSWRCINTTTS